MTKHNKGRKTQTRVEVETQREQRVGMPTLTPDEEKVVRMLHGLSEADDHPLEYAVGASEDSKLRLAVMEAQNIAVLDGDVPRRSGDTQGHVDWMVARYGEDASS